MGLTRSDQDLLETPGVSKTQQPGGDATGVGGNTTTVRNANTAAADRVMQGYVNGGDPPPEETETSTAPTLPGIRANPNLKYAVPGTKVTYTIVDKAAMFGDGAGYEFEWSNSGENGRDPGTIQGEDTFSAKITFSEVGEYTVRCKRVLRRSDGSRAEPETFHYSQLVVKQRDVLDRTFEDAKPTDYETYRANMKTQEIALSNGRSERLEPGQTEISCA